VGDGVGEDVEAVLERTYDLVVDGGFVIVDQHDDPAVADAVARFRESRSITAPLERVDWWGVAWRRQKSSEGAAPPAAAQTGGAPARAPLAPPLPADPIDLSVVVVFHDMKREAARTLHSLSRAYQRDIDDLRYEVLAFDNGSSPDERLDADFVASFGPEFRLIDLGPDAPSSPTVALNEGVRLGRGANFMMMVDGAHLVTPGVLHHGMAGLRSYAPAVVAAQQWYVGPGQQPDSVRRGYDQSVEDALFEQIDWPADGYRIFEVSHFIGERDWFDGVFESNCFLVPRSVMEQVGGFDDAFAMPGGGYTNLEVFERLAAAPDVNLVTIIGEGSFHQVHGGITTNDTDVEDRRKKTFAYGEDYQQLRGRLLRGPTTPMHFVGAFTSAEAKRTRSRRMTGRAFATKRLTEGPDGLPERPMVFPDDLRQSFIESFWNSLAWRDVSWYGRSLECAPTDLVLYQELIASVRPDWIVETGTGNGARALFLASVCEGIDHGQVLSIDGNHGDDLPKHPRITYLERPPAHPDTFGEVRQHVGDAKALVILGARVGQTRTVQEFEGYSPLVSVGSYVVVEHTVVNGRPVWPGFGPGPDEAVRQILQTHGNFAADSRMERFGLTFNLGGYLKRMS
jgi:cephalosporin hydroxylase